MHSPEILPSSWGLGWVEKSKKKPLDQTYAHPNYNFSSFHIKMDLTY